MHKSGGRVKLYAGFGGSPYYTKAILHKVQSSGRDVYGVYADHIDANTLGGGTPIFPSTRIFDDMEKDSDCVYVCKGNPIYAEEVYRLLISAGYADVRLPSSIGMEKSPNKLRALEFNLNIGCSLNCFYCPQKVLINSYLSTTTDKDKVHLSFDDFKFIVDERINPGGSVGFSGMSEPFENQGAVEMICYAFQTGHPVLLNTTLMGLSLEKFEQLSTQVACFEKIQLHIPDQEERSHFKITEEYKELVKLFIKKYHSDIAFFSCHGTIKDEVADAVKNWDIPVFGADTFSDRAGNLDSAVTGAASKMPKGTKIVCREGGKSQIHVPVVMPDGRLALCCNDYSPKWDIGNIIDESWGTILDGKGWREFLDGLDVPNANRCWICSTAVERKFALHNVYPDWYIYGDNFLRIKNGLSKRNSGSVLAQIKNAKHLCIYGLGKFFKDSYYSSYWNTILKADMFSDGNAELYGTKIMGIPVVPKEQLVEYDGLLVIIYVKNDEAIRNDLKQCGVENMVNIADIMEALG